MKKYIQLYSYEDEGASYLQKNIFGPDRRLYMQTYFHDGDMEAKEENLVFELDYLVQDDKYESLVRSMDKYFDNFHLSSDNSKRLLIEEDGNTQAREANPEGDPLFDRIYEKFTRIVSFSSIPSG